MQWGEGESGARAGGESEGQSLLGGSGSGDLSLGEAKELGPSVNAAYAAQYWTEGRGWTGEEDKGAEQLCVPQPGRTQQNLGYAEGGGSATRAPDLGPHPEAP
ncbi:hypothetical protein P7K49_014934 [Saguinus oedipus]|uniref:Androgen receptor n=1 Tax=Saguinus oedipus TaxID=9490 RepID=A0ABQ9V8M4_SAGOE|nr:hypothetical protein P7K49_014934 [Saguinus oedipus]